MYNEIKVGGSFPKYDKYSRYEYRLKFLQLEMTSGTAISTLNFATTVSLFINLLN